MIHRPFIFRSFRSPTYAHTRRTCIAAATTILREHEAITQCDDLSIWTHTAFCITAAVILCFEVLHRGSVESPEVASHRDAIQAARDRLIARKDDVLASRGVTLIDVLSLEISSQADGPVAAAEDTSRGIDLSRVVSKFSAANASYNKHGPSELDAEDCSWNMLDFAFEVDDHYMEDLSGLPSIGDFDEWYNKTFN